DVHEWPTKARRRYPLEKPVTTLYLWISIFWMGPWMLLNERTPHSVSLQQAKICALTRLEDVAHLGIVRCRVAMHDVVCMSLHQFGHHPSVSHSFHPQLVQP